MTPLMRDLFNLSVHISEADAELRYRFQHQLAWLMDQCDSSGLPVPPSIRALNEELLVEVMEAQFDNMPV